MGWAEHAFQRHLQLLNPAPGIVRCSCGAYLFKLRGPCQLEIKCRRCGRILEISTGHKT